MPRTPRGAITLAEEHPRSRGQRRGFAALVLVVLVVLGGAGWLGIEQLRHAVAGEQCRVAVSGTTYRWAPDQASNAAAITAISIKRGLPPRAASIAIATAMQESKVRNIEFGDRDSLGLFQQRPSQGWGTREQILDPEHSTNSFYDELVKVEDYTSMEITDAAQKVQRSAAGKAYAQHEGQARATASALVGQTPAGFGCALKDPEQAGDATALVALLDKDFGLEGTVRGTTVTVATGSSRSAWAVAAWGVARAWETGALTVSTHDRQWTRTMEDSAFSWQPGGSTGDTTVVFTLA